MGYLNKFATQAVYDTGKYDVDAPAISYIEATGAFIFDKTKPTPPKPTANGVYIKYADGWYSNYDTLLSGKTPVGVALKTNAYSLCIHPSEGGMKQWSTNASTQISGVTTTDDREMAQEDYAGKANTAAAVASGLAGSAFTFATDLGADWYLPACGEMEQIRLNATNINTAMTLIGGTALNFSSNNYWASTQHSNTYSWRWYKSYSSWDTGNKAYTNYCRAVSDF